MEGYGHKLTEKKGEEEVKRFWDDVWSNLGDLEGVRKALVRLYQDPGMRGGRALDPKISYDQIFYSCNTKM
jgi:hypothetical protein